MSGGTHARRQLSMRLLYLDLDTLRPDHLGCYGTPGHLSEHRPDRIGGVVFNRCYTSDARACLPVRR
jgi:arylsulfatase A-like enzyme